MRSALRFIQRPSRFGANFLRLSDFPSPVKPIRTAQNLKNQPAHKAPEPLRLTGKISPGLAMACFVWEPRSGDSSGAPPHFPAHPNYPSNQLPISSKGAAHGRREAPLLISSFPRVAQATPLCNPLQTLLFQLVATESEYLPNSLRATPPACGKPPIPVGNQKHAPPPYRPVPPTRSRIPNRPTRPLSSVV